MKLLLPKGYNWRCQYAKKENKKGRTVGDVVTGVKSRWDGAEKII